MTTTKTTYLTQQDIADLLNVSLSTVNNLRTHHGLPFTKVGNSVRIREADLTEWLEARTQKGT